MFDHRFFNYTNLFPQDNVSFSTEGTQVMQLVNDAPSISALLLITLLENSKWNETRKKTGLLARPAECHVGYFNFTLFAVAKLRFPRRLLPTFYDTCCYVPSFTSRCSNCLAKLLNIPECCWSIPKNTLWFSRQWIISTDNMWHVCHLLR